MVTPAEEPEALAPNKVILLLLAAFRTLAIAYQVIPFPETLGVPTSVPFLAEETNKIINPDVGGVQEAVA